MSWDLTQDVGRDKSVNRTDSVIMVDGDWTLERASWMEFEIDGIVWARHYGCHSEAAWRPENQVGGGSLETTPL